MSDPPISLFSFERFDALTEAWPPLFLRSAVACGVTVPSFIASAAGFFFYFRET